MRRYWNVLLLFILVIAAGVFFWTYLAAALTLVAESAPYLLIGFVLAGLLRTVIPENKVYQHLGGDRFKAVTFASLFGIPLPLCSCSVLPVATSLRKSGASKGATTSFLISTPETGLDSIGITYALLDPIMTVARPVAAFVTALFTGSLVNVLVQRGWDRDNSSDQGEPILDDHRQHDHGPMWSPVDSSRKSAWEVVRESTTYAFGPLMDDLTPWFVIGFLISGVIAVAIPDGFFGEVVTVGWASSVLMLLIGTPIYICAAAATPVAAALIAKGLDPGAALVLLLVGPATNATTMIIIARLLGRRVLTLHLLGVTGCALILGAIINVLYVRLGIDLSTVVAAVVESGLSPINAVAIVLLLYFLTRSAARIHMLSQWGRQIQAICAPLGFDPLSAVSRMTVFALIAVMYLSTSFSVIGLGETGWVVRFGRVIRTLSDPGLYVHLPQPFERTTRLRPQEVRSVELGFARPAVIPTPQPSELQEAQTNGNNTDGEDARQKELADEAEVMTGEENILSITYAVHFNILDPYAYRYRVADPVKVVRSFAEWALRKAVAQRSSSEILVTNRGELERDTLAILQAELDTIGSGVQAITVTLQNVHASQDVHAAYRDVASALEDKERSIRQSEGYYSETLARSRAEAFTITQEAESYRSEKVNVAMGETSAFLARQQAYQRNPKLTRRRLFFETAEAALGEAQMILLLGEDAEVDLWNLGNSGRLSFER